jgi:hypothetical protein
VPTLPFAATKIQPPRQRRARLARGALEAALAAALGCSRVVLLHAPAGYGKTSLLAALPGLLPPGTPLAWVSLDEDDDEQRFFACLSAALEAHDLPWRIAPEALAGQLGHADDAAGRALTELVHALAGAEVAQGLIVLDDVHRVAGSRVPALLEALIDRLPAHWTVLLASRVLPPLPLARWRAAGELQLFDQERLAFSADEVAALAAADGAAARAAELYERTRGWPAGLRLLLAAPAGSAASRTLDREVFDFIAAEVLDEMPVALHDFLLRVSARRAPPSASTRSSAAASSRPCWKPTSAPSCCTTCSARPCSTACAAAGRSKSWRCCAAPPTARPTPCAASASCCVPATGRPPRPRWPPPRRRCCWPAARASCCAWSTPSTPCGASTRRACNAWPRWPACCAGTGSRWPPTCAPPPRPRAAWATATSRTWPRPTSPARCTRWTRTPRARR